VLTRQVDGLPAYSCTLRWTDEGLSAGSARHFAHLVALQTPARLPDLRLRPHQDDTARDRRTQDVVTESPEFNAAWRVQGSDLRAVHGVLHPATLERLMAEDVRGAHLRTERAWLLVWWPGRTDPALLGRRIEAVLDLAWRIPRHVWQDQGWDPLHPRAAERHDAVGPATVAEGWTPDGWVRDWAVTRGWTYHDPDGAFAWRWSGPPFAPADAVQVRELVHGPVDGRPVHSGTLLAPGPGPRAASHVITVMLPGPVPPVAVEPRAGAAPVIAGDPGTALLDRMAQPDLREARLRTEDAGAILWWPGPCDARRLEARLIAAAEVAALICQRPTPGHRYDPMTAGPTEEQQ
jgi:hypothetical protein